MYIFQFVLIYDDFGVKRHSSTCVKLATFSATFLATSSKSLENQDIGQTDHVEHKYDLHFDLRLDLQGQIRGQRTGDGLEVKVADRFAIFLLQEIAYQNG